MVDNTELRNFLKKLSKLINKAEFSAFGYSLVKKAKIDDALVCFIALLPDSYKKAMKKRTPLDLYPSVASFNRLYKLIRKPFFLSADLYMFKTTEIITLLQVVNKNIERDINTLEEETNGII